MCTGGILPVFLGNTDGLIYVDGLTWIKKKLLSVFYMAELTTHFNNVYSFSCSFTAPHSLCMCTFTLSLVFNMRCFWYHEDQMVIYSLLKSVHAIQLLMFISTLSDVESWHHVIGVACLGLNMRQSCSNHNVNNSWCLVAKIPWEFKLTSDFRKSWDARKPPSSMIVIRSLQTIYSNLEKEIFDLIMCVDFSLKFKITYFAQNF